MVIRKKERAKKRASIETRKLFEELEHRGYKVLIDFWDRYKHIDIAIPQAKLNIEVDGMQHNYNSKQALSDLKRTYYSIKKGYYTLRIPNSLIKSDFRECCDFVSQIIEERIKQIE